MPLPMLAIAGAGAAANIVGGILARDAMNNAANSQEEIMRQAMAAIDAIDLPDYEKMRLKLEVPKVVSEYSPEQLVQSYQESVKTDENLRGAQMGALEQLGQMGKAGLTEADIAALRQVRRDVEADSQSRQAGILDQMARRGMAGGGSELAARTMAGQQAASRQAEAADKQAMMAQQRALDAMVRSASLAGDVRGQDFSEASRKAQAMDEVSRFNTQVRNQALLRRAEEGQRVADAGTTIRNQEQQFNRDLERQRYQDRLAKEQAKFGGSQSLANIAGQRGQTQANFLGGMGQAIGSAVTSLGAKYGSGGGEKKAIDPDKLDKFGRTS
jgi:hypothetical protein